MPLLVALLAFVAAGGATPPALDSATALLDSGEYAAALEAARRILQDDPRSARAHFVAGVSALRLSRLDEAEKHLRRVARREPVLPETDYHLGEVYLALGNEHRARGKEKIALTLYDEAAAAFGRELVRSPRHAGALAGRARALTRRGERSRAIEALEEWISSSPEDPSGYLALSGLYADEGRGAEALAILEQIPESEGAAVAEASRVVFVTACALFESGQPDQGRRLLGRLQSSGEESWRTAGLEALDLIERSEPFAAAESLMRFLSLDPPTGELERVVGVYHRRFSAFARAGFETSGEVPPGEERLPELVLRVVPEYPSRAKTRGFGARVLLLVVVGETGEPQRVEAISHDVPRYESVYGAMFDRAAETAVRQWRYRPATRAGRPVVFPLTVDLGFSVE